MPISEHLPGTFSHHLGLLRLRHHTLFRFYFKDIQELHPRFIREIAFEKINKQILEFPPHIAGNRGQVLTIPPPPPKWEGSPLRLPPGSQLRRLQICHLHTNIV